MEHGIACHPTQMNTQCLTPARHAGTRFTYPVVVEGCVDLSDRLHTEIVYKPAHGYPSKYKPGTTWPEVIFISKYGKHRQGHRYPAKPHVQRPRRQEEMMSPVEDNHVRLATSWLETWSYHNIWRYLNNDTMVQLKKVV